MRVVNRGRPKRRVAHQPAVGSSYIRAISQLRGERVKRLAQMFAVSALPRNSRKLRPSLRFTTIETKKRFRRK